MLDIKKWLEYDPDTGIFTWIKSKQKVVVGSVAGWRDKNGYICIFYNSKQYYAHRLAWWWIKGEWPIHLIDHKNMIRSDNKFDNLRECNHPQNHGNIKSKKKYKGIFLNKKLNRWYGKIMINGKSKSLGGYKTEEEAAKAYDEAALKFFGEFARLNYGDT